MQRRRAHAHRQSHQGSAPRTRRHHHQERGSPSRGARKSIYARAELVALIHAHRPLAAITDDIPPTTGTDNSIVAALRARLTAKDALSPNSKPRYATATTPSRASTANSTVTCASSAAPLPSLATLDTVAAETSDPHPGPWAPTQVNHR